MRLDRRGIGIGKETNLTAAVADARPQKPDTTVASSASPRPVDRLLNILIRKIVTSLCSFVGFYENVLKIGVDLIQWKFNDQWLL